MTDPRVRVRGIYTTAVTSLLLEADLPVVQASEPIRTRFDRQFGADLHDVAVETTDDRQGLELVGPSDGVDRVATIVTDVGIDVLTWLDPTPPGTVYDGVVSETRGGGALVDLGEAQGYLPYDDVDDFLETGDRCRVQVKATTPPWTDAHPTLGTELRAPGGVVELVNDRPRITADHSGDRATELTRTVELLSTEVPEGWGVHWLRGAEHVGFDDLDAALETAAERALAIETALDTAGPARAADGPTELITPVEGRWVWFGRTTRFNLDEHRGAVTTTMAGHHRIKAAHPSAGTAVDLVEAVCDDPTIADEGPDFPFAAVTEQFGPREGDRVTLAHGKPDGRLLRLGRATVAERGQEGKVVLRRKIQSRGEYDGLGTTREPGDVAITRVKEGRWWYPTVYRSDDGHKRGTYVNVCTPVEVFPDSVRYVDLHVDVVKTPDGVVERVDDDELDAAVGDGAVPPALAERARAVAERVEDAL